MDRAFEAQRRGGVKRGGVPQQIKAREGEGGGWGAHKKKKSDLSVEIPSHLCLVVES